MEQWEGREGMDEGGGGGGGRKMRGWRGEGRGRGREEEVEEEGGRKETAMQGSHASPLSPHTSLLQPFQ